MTNEDWLEHFGLGWLISSAKRKNITDKELRELKRMAMESKPFAPSEHFPIITEEMEARAQKNGEFFRAATLLVPLIVDELLKFRK